MSKDVASVAAPAVKAPEPPAAPISVAIVQPREAAPQPNTPKAFLGSDPGPGLYLVTLGERTSEVSAPNRGDAFAAFCDKHKQWPGPKINGLSIEFIGKE